MDQFLFRPKPKPPRDTGMGDLFEQPQPPKENTRRAPYQLSSATSREAAERAEPRSASDRRKLLAEIRNADQRLGLTRPELCNRTGILNQTACARLNELEEGREIRKLTQLVNGKVQLVRRDGCSAYVLRKPGDRA